jgi:hypothetical protein
MFCQAVLLVPNIFSAPDATSWRTGLDRAEPSRKLGTFAFCAPFMTTLTFVRDLLLFFICLKI